MICREVHGLVGPAPIAGNISGLSEGHLKYVAPVQVRPSGVVHNKPWLWFVKLQTAISQTRVTVNVTNDSYGYNQLWLPVSDCR